MRSRLLPIYLPKEVYSRLEEAAIAEERDPIQQARFILRQALTGGTAQKRRPVSADCQSAQQPFLPGLEPTEDNPAH